MELNQKKILNSSNEKNRRIEIDDINAFEILFSKSNNFLER